MYQIDLFERILIDVSVVEIYKKIIFEGLYNDQEQPSNQFFK